MSVLERSSGSQTTDLPRPGSLRSWSISARVVGTLGLALLTLVVPRAESQEHDAAKWDVTLARGRTRSVDFTTDEGTWMSVDISPDQKWIVFDLLGEIYRIPASGAQAENLTRGPGVATNFHPRYSPDGSTIAFVSDREGQYNLWLMDGNGSNPRPVFLDPTIRVFMPVWTPDGEYIIVRQCEMCLTHRGGSNGIWIYHRDGGRGVELLGGERGREMINEVSWPSVSPDGRYLYFQTYKGPVHDVTMIDALRGHWQIERLDLETGEIVSVTRGETLYSNRGSSGGAYAPEIAPDGHRLAFARRIPDGTISFKGHRFGPRTALWIRDLRTGAERAIMDPITTDLAESAKFFRLLPAYAWTSDARSIILSQGGKIRRLNVETGAVTTIPFTARVQRTLSEQARSEFRITDEPFRTLFTRWHAASPDRRTLAFQAVGKVFLMDLPKGTPRRLTSDSFEPFEYSPAWSPDGKWIAFTTWGDDGGHLWKVQIGRGRPERLTQVSAEYLNPAWSPDGSAIVVARGTGALVRGRGVAHNPYWDLVRVRVVGGPAEVVATVPVSEARGQVVRPSFGPEGRIFFPEQIREGDEGRTVNAFVSVRPDGSDRRVHLGFPSSADIVTSPDGRYVAFQAGYNVYVAPYRWRNGEGKPAFIQTDAGRGAFPVRKLSTEGGLDPRWIDENSLVFGSGAHFYLYDVRARTTDTIEIDLRVPQRIPKGSIALTGARIVTLVDREVSEEGTILVEGSRIVCVGRCDTSGADRVMDVSGTTIIPGFVDMHAHHHGEDHEIIPQRSYEQAVYLAYGVTTTQDPSAWPQNVFPTAELIRAGKILGPRTYTAGDALTWNWPNAPTEKAITSLEAAQANVNRLASWGATAIKQYLQLRREQRQWVAEAARRRGITLTAEGSPLVYNVGMILDGHAGWEHPMSYGPLYRDVAKFFGEAAATYSASMVVVGLGPWNDQYFFQESDWWKDEKQQRFVPWRQLIPHLRRRTLRPDSDYSYPLIAQGVADIIAEGGWGAIGSHGQHPGLASHWEVWIAASAMGPMGALELASVHGARFVGGERDLGTLEAGKLADLMVLNANPLDDIRNTMDIRYVMQGGILYDAETLDELWPENRPFGEYWWVNPDVLRADDRPATYWDIR